VQDLREANQGRGTAGMTFLKQLRDAAMQCSNVDYQSTLRAVVNTLETAITDLGVDPTEDHMRVLNAAWSKAARVLANVPPEADPAPLGGSVEPARLAA